MLACMDSVWTAMDTHTNTHTCTQLLYGCYAHSSSNPDLHRRTYWLINVSSNQLLRVRPTVNLYTDSLHVT